MLTVFGVTIVFRRTSHIFSAKLSIRKPGSSSVLIIYSDEEFGLADRKCLGNKMSSEMTHCNEYKMSY